MIVHCNHDVEPGTVERKVQLHTRRGGPLPLQNVAVDVDADHVFEAELVPQKEPGIRQERAVFEPVRDVPGEMIVVAFAPQRAGEQHDFPSPRQGREQPVLGGAERHGWLLTVEG